MFSFFFELYWFFWIQLADGYGHRDDHKSKKKEIDEKYKIDLKKSRAEAARRAREKAIARARAEDQSEHEHHGVSPEYTADRTGGTHKKLELPRHNTNTGEPYKGGYSFARGEFPTHPEPTFLRRLGKMFCVII